MSEERLDRIEEKIDKLSEAMVQLARIDERIVTLFQRDEMYRDLMNQNRDEINKTRDIVSNMQHQRTANTAVTERISKLFWTFITAGIIGMSSMFFMLTNLQ